MSWVNDIISVAASTKKSITAQLDTINQQVADIIPPPPAQNTMSEEQLWQQNWKVAYDKELAKKPQNQVQIKRMIEVKARHDYPGGPAAYDAKFTSDAVSQSYRDSIAAGMDAAAKAANPFNWLEWAKSNWPWVAGLGLIFGALWAFASGYGKGKGGQS